MDTPSPAQTFYAGEFRHSIDEKNRITIPSRWRGDGAEEFVILPEASDQFLLVMPPEEFSRMSAAIETDAQCISARSARFFRQLHARAQHGAADARAASFCRKNFASEPELKGEVALVGGRGRFEIWNLSRWKRAHQDETPTYQHVANVVGL